MGKHEELGRLVLELKRHGFTQLRRTTHGYLYGYQEHRFSLPHALPETFRGPDRIGEAWRNWNTLKADAGLTPTVAAVARGGDRPSVVDAMAPVMNPDDLLVDLETERPEPAGSPGAPEDAPPSGSTTTPPPPQEERPMAKRKRRSYTPWTCPKCGKTFAAPGRHVGSCPGTAGKVGDGTINGNIRRSGPRRLWRTAAGKPVVVKPTDYPGLVEAFQAAATGLVGGITALVAERDHYRTERNELSKKFEALRGLFK